MDTRAIALKNFCQLLTSAEMNQRTIDDFLVEGKTSILDECLAEVAPSASERQALVMLVLSDEKIELANFRSLLTD